jgi:hypothetical protein
MSAEQIKKYITIALVALVAVAIANRVPQIKQLTL